MEKIYVTKNLGTPHVPKCQISRINKLNSDEKKIYYKFIELKNKYKTLKYGPYTYFDMEKYIITYIPHILVKILDNINNKMIYFIASSHKFINNNKVYKHDEIDIYTIIGFYKFDNEDDAKYYFTYALKNDLLPPNNNYFLGKYNISISKFEKNEYKNKIKKLEKSIREYKY